MCELNEAPLNKETLCKKTSNIPYLVKLLLIIAITALSLFLTACINNQEATTQEATPPQTGTEPPA